MMGWISNLLANVRYYVYGGVFLLVSGLLVALKLKDSELHSFQVKDMESRFKAEQDRANERVEAEKRKYEG